MYFFQLNVEGGVNSKLQSVNPKITKQKKKSVYLQIK